MANLFGRCFKHRKSGRDETSSKTLYGHVVSGISHFVGGLATGLVVFWIFVAFSSVPADPTLSVTKTNEVWTGIWMALFYALVSFLGIKGAFGLSLDNIFIGTYESMQFAIVAALDGRIPWKRWWLFLLPLVNTAFVSAGFISAAALLKASYGTTLFSVGLKPLLVNVVQQSLVWVYLWSTLLYTFYLHILIFTCNYTTSYYANLLPGTAALFAFGAAQFGTSRLLPSFAFNWAWCFLTDSYELLGIDVAAGFSAMLLTTVLYWFVFQSEFQPDQNLERVNYHIPYNPYVPVRKEIFTEHLVEWLNDYMRKKKQKGGNKAGTDADSTDVDMTTNYVSSANMFSAN